MTIRKYIAGILITAACVLSLLLALNIYAYNVYTKNLNGKINAVVNAVLGKYDEVTEEEIIGILNGADAGDHEVLDKYGIDVEKGSVITANERYHRLFAAAGAAILTTGAAVLLVIFLRYDRKRSEDIAGITEMIEQINKRNYELNIGSISEDELSILKNEIYKTTVTLREAADRSNADKLELKKALEDISHQLKTPLTSILIMLDVMIDDPEMEPSVRDDFIRGIKRETANINYFVRAILSLSKLESNTIRFIKEKTTLGSLAEEAVKNVSALCDLLGIKILLDGEREAEIECDRKWQTEAITNILKNSVDHSPEGGKIVIRCGRTGACSTIEITDFGEGIPPEDIPHIFERFYKGKNASADSTGIGLALSKSIIEEANGIINVDSGAEGTRFRINYVTV